MNHDRLLHQLEMFDKTSLKHTPDPTNKREPPSLKDLATETAAYYWKQLNISNLNLDTLWLLFRAISRRGKLTDEIIKKIVEETDCIFYDVERYDVRYNVNMTYNGLKYLTKLMPNLQFIDISGSNLADTIQTYQHLFSRSKLKEIRTTPLLDQKSSAQLTNLAWVFQWNINPWFTVMTKQLQ